MFAPRSGRGYVWSPATRASSRTRTGPLRAAAQAVIQRAAAHGSAASTRSVPVSSYLPPLSISGACQYSEPTCVIVRSAARSRDAPTGRRQEWERQWRARERGGQLRRASTHNRLAWLRGRCRRGCWPPAVESGERGSLRHSIRRALRSRCTTGGSSECRYFLRAAEGRVGMSEAQS